MKLTVLVDNNTYIDRYYLGEPAACYLVEDGAQTILFDTGYSDVFIENAARMGIDLARVTDIVLSHGHNDHTGGLPAFFSRFSQPVRVTAHLGAFQPKRAEGLDVGSPLSLAQLPDWVEIRLPTKPRTVSEHVVFLGEIPRVYPFEQDRAVGETAKDCCCCWEPDGLADDTSLALVLEDGVFVVTGCAHAGVCNTVARAKEQTGKQRVLGVLGGFHLFETGETLTQTVDTLLALGVERVYPAHCTSLAVKSAFVRAFDTVEVGVGLTLEW
ncbi:MAG: MBL fold metallo-hydrolase [Clostridiales bacterium]|nr:MBL fold metallo-hydrolase [Clostridiales bacterium]